MIARTLSNTISKVCRVPAFNFAKEVEIKSVAGHKPPAYEESVHGKYAGVLFSVASQQESLFTTLKDMKFFAELNQGEQFRSFIINQTLNAEQQKDIINSLSTDYSTTTQQFLNTLIENRRLNSLGKIADKYVEYYKILNKEENIIITSAVELTSEQKDKVKSALVQGRGSSNFTLNYEIDASIQGGLTMTCGMEFLDCSLATRYNRLKQELSKLSL